MSDIMQSPSVCYLDYRLRCSNYVPGCFGCPVAVRLGFFDYLYDDDMREASSRLASETNPRYPDDL